MSSASVTSSKREKLATELQLELESVKSINSCLEAYLLHIRTFKRNLLKVTESCNELSKVNQQWLDTINAAKKL